ncbi:MAG: GDSL family lipase [Planctomycetes bacterium]|nr:GDSL family lipase [Planctomycetota bacterium]
MFSEMVVFGDSLSDNGNLFAENGGTFPASPPYFEGRFSNGPVWVEELAPMLGLNESQFTDLAKGAATTQQVLEQQVTPFVTGGNVNANALYVVWAGPDDFIDLAETGVTPTIEQAVANISASITALADAGAQNILVGNMPNLGRTPFAVSAGPLVVIGATSLSNTFNAALNAEMNALELNLGLDLMLLDAFEFGEQQIAGAPGNGFTNIDTAFLTDGRSTHADPDEFLFWDDVHPTAEAHRRLANFAMNVIPEPASFGLMAMGVLIASIRRRGLRRT